MIRTLKKEYEANLLSSNYGNKSKLYRHLKSQMHTTDYLQYI